ncbi:unnamed protein product [Leptidea sinapis]|uniref:Cation-dependent mannose-6-phosphate receptor n=1 Tax=Leptidea sinapis TaxID=189913 RepID=A0A5E4Q822_9NEOP|nr:unnamed protein product [Leptidea sinapis]
MESKLCIFGIVLFCITFNTNIVSAQDVCVKKGPCSCEFSNGTGINLSPLANAAFYSTNTFDLKSEGTQYELSTYYYHPCIDAKPVVNSTKTTDTCGIPLAICRQVDTFNFNKTISGYVTDGGIYEYMGSSNFSQFSSDGKSIIYMNPPSSTIVMLVCAQTDGELNVISLSDPQKIIEEFSRSLGSTLLIIFFSCVIFYIVLGVCVNKLLRGATGLEVVPNLAFWTDLPNLVKLPARGAGPVTSPDPNSYDSI